MEPKAEVVVGGSPDNGRRRSGRSDLDSPLPRRSSVSHGFHRNAAAVNAVVRSRLRNVFGESQALWAYGHQCEHTATVELRVDDRADVRSAYGSDVHGHVVGDNGRHLSDRAAPVAKPGGALRQRPLEYAGASAG